MFYLDADSDFPPVELADDYGLLAVGGDLSVSRLRSAYAQGIFPWYGEDDPILWWSPDPRFVLYPEELHISKNLERDLRKTQLEFRIGEDFRTVIQNCQKSNRKGQRGTWINDELIESFVELHEQGIATCAAVYREDVMVGGLYGVIQNRAFCGESMFYLESGASKICFAKFVPQLAKMGVEIIDCQVHTAYLESFGARFIERIKYLTYL